MDGYLERLEIYFFRNPYEMFIYLNKGDILYRYYNGEIFLLIVDNYDSVLNRIMVEGVYMVSNDSFNHGPLCRGMEFPDDIEGYATTQHLNLLNNNVDYLTYKSNFEK